MRVVRWRPANSLRGIIDNCIQTIKPPAKKFTKSLDTRNESKIEAENVQPVTPLIVVLLFRIPSRSIAREACRRDNCRVAPQQFKRHLVTYFYTTSRDETYSARKITSSSSPRIVELSTGWAQLIIKVMQSIETRFANVAGTWTV